MLHSERLASDDANTALAHAPAPSPKGGSAGRRAGACPLVHVGCTRTGAPQPTPGQPARASAHATRARRAREQRPLQRGHGGRARCPASVLHDQQDVGGVQSTRCFDYRILHANRVPRARLAAPRASRARRRREHAAASLAASCARARSGRAAAARRACGLSHERGGGRGLILPRRRQRLDRLVVARDAVDARLDQNEAELRILVLAEALEMLADGDGLLDEHVQILGHVRRQPVLLQDAQDL
mmetsp:Transcript_4931/g.15347  ORF Transcript_4931/g.15347 Transcript_4931/m.15347 type:complete len:243 (+) Transcript_4931:81-809(+)